MNLRDLDILFTDFAAIYSIYFSSIWLEMNFMRMVEDFIDIGEVFDLGIYYKARVTYILNSIENL